MSLVQHIEQTLPLLSKTVTDSVQPGICGQYKLKELWYEQYELGLVGLWTNWTKETFHSFSLDVRWGKRGWCHAIKWMQNYGEVLCLCMKHTGNLKAKSVGFEEASMSLVSEWIEKKICGELNESSNRDKAKWPPGQFLLQILCTIDIIW